MASRAIDLWGASALPLSQAFSIIPSLPRPLLSRLVARAIERLDEIDGDPDYEPDGDEWDGTCAEDEAGAELYALPNSGPGCIISDDDRQEIEWRAPVSISKPA